MGWGHSFGKENEETNLEPLEPNQVLDALARAAVAGGATGCLPSCYTLNPPRVKGSGTTNRKPEAGIAKVVDNEDGCCMMRCSVMKEDHDVIAT